MAKVLDAFRAVARSFVETLSRSSDHPGVNCLGEAVKNFIESAALMIPKKASGLSNAKVDFQRSLPEHKGSIVSRWTNLVDSDDVNLGQDKTGRLRQYLLLQYNIPDVGNRICQRRTSGGTDPGQGKARQVCLTRDLLRCRLDIVQCLPGANHLSTGERIILFICPAEQHNKGRRGKGKVANRYRGEADVARGKNVCFESILQFYLFG